MDASLLPNQGWLGQDGLRQLHSEKGLTGTIGQFTTHDVGDSEVLPSQQGELGQGWLSKQIGQSGTESLACSVVGQSGAESLACSVCWSEWRRVTGLFSCWSEWCRVTGLFSCWSEWRRVTGLFSCWSERRRVTGLFREKVQLRELV